MRPTLRITLLIGIFLLGFVLRIYRLDAIALRGDEAFSVQRWAAEPLHVSLTEIASLEPHPPLTYVLFRGWGLLFGTYSEFMLRLLPVFFNMLGISAMYALARNLSRFDAVALMASLLWALHPFEIWHAQDFRNYGVWAGLSVIVLWLAIRIIIAGKRNMVDWLVYALVAITSCLVFYNELITIGVLGLYVLLWHRQDRKFVLRWSILNAGIVFGTVTAFIVFQGDLITSGQYGGTTGGFELQQIWQRFLPVLSFADTLSLSLQQQFSPSTIWWPVVLMIVAASVVVGVRERSPQRAFMLMLAFVPLIVIALISIRLRIFRPRYVMLAVPGYILLVSSALVILWHKGRARAGALVLAALWLSLTAISLNNYYHNPAYAKAQDWRQLVHFLESVTSPDDVIIQTGVDASFGYYYERADISSDEFALPADVTQPIPEIIDTLEVTADAYRTIWIVGQTFPDWPNAGVVEDWAHENLLMVHETQIAGLPVRQFLLPSGADDIVVSAPLTSFSGAIDLMAAYVLERWPDDVLPVLLYWRPEQRTGTPLTAFVHLVGGINPETGTPLWTQDDHPPQDGFFATNTWDTGIVYRDVFRLDLATIPSGTYRLMVGFYDPETGTRLLTRSGEDAFTIAEITIE